MCVRRTYSNAFFLKAKDILYSTNPKKKKQERKKNKTGKEGGRKACAVRGVGCVGGVVEKKPLKYNGGGKEKKGKK